MGSGPLECDSVPLGDWLLIFWRCYKPVICLEPFIWEPKRPKSTETQLRKPQITDQHTHNISLSLCLKSEDIQWSLHNPQWIKNSSLFKITRQAMQLQCNIQASLNHFCSRKAISIICSECVFVALFIQHAMHMQHIILSPVACPALPYFFRLSHKQ